MGATKFEAPLTERRDTPYVVAVSGLSVKQLNYWLSCGAISLESEDNPGSGVPRRYTLGEVADLTVLGRIVRKASAAGLKVTVPLVARVWEALAAGRPWRLVLDIDEEG